MKDTIIAIIVLSLLVAVFSVYGPKVESERTGGNWLMAGVLTPGSIPGKGEGEGEGEGEGNTPNRFTLGQFHEQTQGETAQTEPGSAFSLTVTVEKVKEQIARWQVPTWEALLCGGIVGVAVTQLVMALALTAAWLIGTKRCQR